MDTYLHSQQRNATCAVASMRTILHRQFGLRIAEAALVALGRTASATILDEGTDTGQLRRMVRLANEAYNTGPPWTLRVRRHGTVRQLAYWVRRGRWPMVQVYVTDMDQHHAIVVLEVQADRVVYFDPDPTEGRLPKVMARDQFVQWWTSPVTGERWWAVVNGGTLTSVVV